MPSTKTYPDNWKQLSEDRKAEVGHKCERCNVRDSHDPKDGNCLTVHHLVPDTTINETWNLAALCQRCHLHMKNVNLYQGYLFEITGWLKWHLDGFIEWHTMKQINSIS